MRDRLGTVAMPEQLFGDSYLRLTHESGAAIDFNAADALAAWKAEGLPPVQVRCRLCCDPYRGILGANMPFSRKVRRCVTLGNFDRSVHLQVGHASQWQSERKESLSTVAALNYDW